MAITPEILAQVREAVSNPDTIVQGLELLDQHAAETFEIETTVREELEATKASLATARSQNMAEYLAKATGSVTPQAEDKPKTWEDMTPEEAKAEFAKRVKGGEE